MKNLIMLVIMTITLSTALAKTTPTPPYTTPAFPGGMEALKTYVTKNLKYPIQAREAAIEGFVTVGFQIDINGNVTQTFIHEGLTKACDEAVIQLIKEMPRWQVDPHAPFIQPIYYKLKIAFRLD